MDEKGCTRINSFATSQGPPDHEDGMGLLPAKRSQRSAKQRVLQPGILTSDGTHQIHGHKEHDKQ